MPQRVVISEAPHTGYAYLVRLPYRSMPFITALKEELPEPVRDWHPRLAAWLFRRNVLDTVRQLAARFAEQEGWIVVDFTAMEKAKALQAQQALEEQEHEEHVAAVLELLPQLPKNALILAGWFQKAMILDLDCDIRLSEPLFTALIRAGLPDRKYSDLPYCPAQSGKTVRVVVSTDHRIISTLAHYSIQHLQVRSDITLTETFDNGTAHGYDKERSLWFGAPFSLALTSQGQISAIYRPGQTYQATLFGGQLSIIGEATARVQEFFHWGYHLVDPSAEKYSADFTLSAFVKHYHLASWLRDWAHRVVMSEECEPRGHYSHRSLWEYSNYWIHPAQGIVELLLSSHEEDIQELLGWEDAYLREQQARIGRIKEQHKANYLRYCREHAVALATPLLQRKSKDELRKLGDEYGIVLRKSWTNEHLIQALTSDTEQSAKLARVLLEIPEQAEALSAV